MQKINGLQITQLREALETKAALLAVEHITEEEIYRLEQIVNKMAVTKDEKSNIALDKALHYTIAVASNNTILIQILSILSDLIETHIKDRRREIFIDKKNITKLQEIHEALVKGIKNRDSNTTYDAISRHFALIAEYYQND